MLRSVRHRKDNRIVRREGRFRSETVKVTSGDTFCAAHGIQKISYLKIDTEGHDYKVLLGFGEMLRAQRVDLVQVEAGMHPGNRRHVRLERFLRLMRGEGYQLFRLYHQTLEERTAILRRADAVFISPALAKRFTAAGAA